VKLLIDNYFKKMVYVSLKSFDPMLACPGCAWNATAWGMDRLQGRSKAAFESSARRRPRWGNWPGTCRYLITVHWYDTPRRGDIPTQLNGRHGLIGHACSEWVTYGNGSVRPPARIPVIAALYCNAGPSCPVDHGGHGLGTQVIQVSEHRTSANHYMSDAAPTPMPTFFREQVLCPLLNQLQWAYLRVSAAVIICSAVVSYLFFNDSFQTIISTFTGLFLAKFAGLVE